VNTSSILVTADIWLETPVDDATLCQRVKVALLDNNVSIVYFHRQDFEPQGVTAFWCLAESHCVLHSYPEHQYCSLDVYCCGSEGQAACVIDQFRHSLPVLKFQQHLVHRGELAVAVDWAQVVAN
jgi:S-adenosylmethionine/arginine decarboxylase-like enzyme